jgi:hypothetical protein
MAGEAGGQPDERESQRPWWWVGGPMFAPTSKMRERHEVDAYMANTLIVEIPDPADATADPTDPSAYDSLGFPETDEAGAGRTWNEWAASCIARAHPEPIRCGRWLETGGFNHLYRRLESDRLLTAELGASFPRRPPSVLVETRGRGATSMFEEASNVVDPGCTQTHMVTATGLGLHLYDAALYWIPGASAAACLTSEPPDKELLTRIQLPFPSVLVGFAEPVPLGALEDQGEYLVVGGHRSERSVGDGDRLLEAVWLTSGPEGTGVGPVAVWFLQYGRGLDASTAASVGVWSRSAFPGVVPNLGALLSWEQWEAPSPPPEPVGDPGGADWRQVLKRSAMKRATRRGATHGIRVLSVPSRAAASNSKPSEDESSRRSPIEHWRRGHWTSVRVATRNEAGMIVGRTDGEQDVDWHYEGRWIRPVLVNVGGPADVGAKVYRLG